MDTIKMLKQEIEVLDKALRIAARDHKLGFRVDTNQADLVRTWVLEARSEILRERGRQ